MVPAKGGSVDTAGAPVCSQERVCILDYLRPGVHVDRDETRQGNNSATLNQPPTSPCLSDSDSKPMQDPCGVSGLSASSASNTKLPLLLLSHAGTCIPPSSACATLLLLLQRAKRHPAMLPRACVMPMAPSSPELEVSATAARFPWSISPSSLFLPQRLRDCSSRWQC